MSKICYVSMAFGVKPDPTSARPVDYDRVYRELILPAVQQAGLTSTRADDFAGTLILKDIAKAVITADVMLADVSNGNANVMYELGIRHALCRGATVLLTSTRLPFNIAQTHALKYDLAVDGGPEPGRLAPTIAQLANVLRRKAEETVNDSPLYEYFPSLRIDLPADLRLPERRSRIYPAEAQGSASSEPDRKTSVERAEQITRSTQNVDPQAYLDLLRRYRNLSEWKEVLRLARELPAGVADLPQVVQTVALALARLDRTDEAIQVLLTPS